MRFADTVRWGRCQSGATLRPLLLIFDASLPR
jgi:hypothetical protein